jgi:hypothetical protein
VAPELIIIAVPFAAWYLWIAVKMAYGWRSLRAADWRTKRIAGEFVGGLIAMLPFIFGIPFVLLHGEPAQAASVELRRLVLAAVGAALVLGGFLMIHAWRRGRSDQHLRSFHQRWLRSHSGRIVGSRPRLASLWAQDGDDLVHRVRSRSASSRAEHRELQLMRAHR